MWLRRHVVAAAVANYDTLAERTTRPGHRRQRAVQPGRRRPGAARRRPPPADVSGVNLAAVESLSAPGGKFGPMMLATRSAMFVPMVLFGVAGSLLGISTLVAAPLSVVLAAGIGQKIIRDEKKRQVAHRRQQAKMAARRYVEEVGFIMNKESRDALRRTQRFLRDDFQLRAISLHRSSTSALGAARQAMQLTGPQRSARVSQLQLGGRAAARRWTPRSPNWSTPASRPGSAADAERRPVDDPLTRRVGRRPAASRRRTGHRPAVPRPARRNSPQRLTGPLRVAIAGKIKAGKSTLLNALVGEELAPTDAGECTRIVTWYRRGDQPQVTVHPHARTAGDRLLHQGDRRAGRRPGRPAAGATSTGWRCPGRRAGWPRSP